MKQRLKGFLAVILTIIISIQIPLGNGSRTEVLAAETLRPDISLGTRVLETEAGDTWSIGDDLLYFGYNVYISGGEQFRILKHDGSRMLLDDNMVSNGTYTGATDWSASLIRSSLNTDASIIISDAHLGSECYLNEKTETPLILTTRHEEEANTGILDSYLCESPETSERVFVLSATEAATYYGNDAARVKSRRNGNTAAYWLRSAARSIDDVSTTQAMAVTAAGAINTESIDSTEQEVYVSPAFWINAESPDILFTSASNAKKDTLAQPSMVDNSIWHLTVIGDGVITMEQPQVTVTGTDASPLTITWQAQSVGLKEATQTYTRYSVLITDKPYTEEDAEIKWYGKVGDIDSMQLQFELPEDYLPTDYVYLLADYISINNTTEYATKPLELKTGIYQVEVDAANTYLTTTDAETQICYTESGYQDNFEAVYTVEEGYYLPEDYTVLEQDGITVTRLSDTQLKVSGTPEANVKVRLTPATQKTTPAEVLQSGSGVVTIDDWYYGGAASSPQVRSATNPTSGVVFEYKEAGAADTTYVTTQPTRVGNYVVRATFPATDTVAEAVAVAEFSIQYLPMPDKAYSLQGERGKRGYYTSNVKVVPAEGYLVAETLDGNYREALTLTASDTSRTIFLMKQSTGEKTAGATILSVLIDKDAPVISGVENGKLYYGDSYQVVVRDANLRQILLNGESVPITGPEMTLSLDANRGIEEYKIELQDAAGNETVCSFKIAAEWMKNGRIPTGELVRLQSDQAYTLENGTWQVSGDTTSYSGGSTFYVKTAGEYTFTKR